MIRFLKIPFLVILFYITVPAQTATNIEKFYSLIEKSAAGIIPNKVQKESRVYIEFSSPAGVSILKNSLIEKTGAYATVAQQKEKSDFILNFTIEDAKVKYGECFTKSFLGRNYVEREVTLKGFGGINRINEDVSTARFEHSAKDTVEYSGLKELANPAYPFTDSNIPAEPFFSSILEPIIAIGAAVTTVYLLFTVRSK